MSADRAARTVLAPRCPHCGRRLPELPSGYARCRRRVCPGYSYIWAGDQRRKLFENLQAYADSAPVDRKQLVLQTAVTAPGVAVLPWDADHCSAMGPHHHTGDLGCRAAPLLAASWNASAPERWRDLHRVVYVRCRREGLAPWMLVRVWELQHRGVLHVHPVLAFTTAIEQRSARRYVQLLAELSPRYGFGFVERKIAPMPAGAAAAYLSSYFIGGRGRKAKLEESVRHAGMPRSIIHVSHRLTGATGCTMRRLRRLRFLYVRGGFVLCPDETYHRVDLFEGHPCGHGYRRVQEAPVAAP